MEEQYYKAIAYILSYPDGQISGQFCKELIPELNIPDMVLCKHYVSEEILILISGMSGYNIRKWEKVSATLLQDYHTRTDEDTILICKE